MEKSDLNDEPAARPPQRGAAPTAAPWQGAAASRAARR